MDWASTHFALYDAWVDDTLWTCPRWRPLVSVNLPVPWLETALFAAWTRTCSVRCLDSNFLCSLPGLELALLAAWTRTCSARSLDSNLFCPLQLLSRNVEVSLYHFSVVPPSDFLLESFGCSTVLIVSTSQHCCTYPINTWHQFCICRLVNDNAIPPGEILKNIAERKQWML